MALSDLQNDVLSRLNEAANSTAGDLRSGTGANATIATLTTITQCLNDAAADLARSAYPVVDEATYTSLPTGTRFVSFGDANLAPSSGAKLWAARSVSWSGTALTRCSRSALELWYPTWRTDATGTPAYWCEQGEDGIEIYPAPSTTANLVVSGLAVPAKLVSPTDNPSWLHSDLTNLLVFHAAARLALKNAEDTSLAARAEIWWGEYKDGEAELLDRLWATDPYVAQAHFTKPTQAVK